ncbi:MAG: hypothetical protein ACYCOU_17525, partial [Sulfobacillus sp.]
MAMRFGLHRRNPVAGAAPHSSRARWTGSVGQSMALVAILMVALLLIPASMTALILGQLPTSKSVVNHSAAMDAAYAGLNDFMNNVNTVGLTYDSCNAANVVHPAAGDTCPLVSNGTGSGNSAFVQWVPALGTSTATGSTTECYFYTDPIVNGILHLTITGRAGPPTGANGCGNAANAKSYQYRTITTSVAESATLFQWLYDSYFETVNPTYYTQLNGGNINDFLNVCGFHAYDFSSSYDYPLVEWFINWISGGSHSNGWGPSPGDNCFEYYPFPDGYWSSNDTFNGTASAPIKSNDMFWTCGNPSAAPGTQTYSGDPNGGPYSTVGGVQGAGPYSITDPNGWNTLQPLSGIWGFLGGWSCSGTPSWPTSITQQASLSPPPFTLGSSCSSPGSSNEVLPHYGFSGTAAYDSCDFLASGAQLFKSQAACIYSGDTYFTFNSGGGFTAQSATVEVPPGDATNNAEPVPTGGPNITQSNGNNCSSPGHQPGNGVLYVENGDAAVTGTYVGSYSVVAATDGVTQSNVDQSISAELDSGGGSSSSDSGVGADIWVMPPSSGQPASIVYNNGDTTSEMGLFAQNSVMIGSTTQTTTSCEDMTYVLWIPTIASDQVCPQHENNPDTFDAVWSSGAGSASDTDPRDSNNECDGCAPATDADNDSNPGGDNDGDAWWSEDGYDCDGDNSWCVGGEPGGCNDNCSWTNGDNDLNQVGDSDGDASWSTDGWIGGVSSDLDGDNNPSWWCLDLCNEPGLNGDPDANWNNNDPNVVGQADTVDSNGDNDSNYNNQSCIQGGAAVDPDSDGSCGPDGNDNDGDESVDWSQCQGSSMLPWWQLGSGDACTANTETLTSASPSSTVTIDAMVDAVWGSFMLDNYPFWTNED